MRHHTYRTTRDVQTSIAWQRIDGKPHGEPTVITQRGSLCVFRGGIRAFRAHLATLNAEHGAGYAVELDSDGRLVGKITSDNAA